MGPKAKYKAAPANCKNDPPSIDLLSRIRGSFIGRAMCDALRGPVEFRARGSYPLQNEMTYNEVFKLGARSWTDDTSTALCLAESLVEYEGESHIGDQVERVSSVPQTIGGTATVSGLGPAHLLCFDIGGLTRATLAFWRDQLQKTGYHDLKPESKKARDISLTIQRAVSSAYSVEPGDKKSGEIYQTPRAGNGTLMRIVPVALFAKSDQNALSVARECSRTTHPHVICSDCCEIYVDIVRMALNGSSKDDMAATMWQYAENEEIDRAITDALKPYKTVKNWAKRRERSIE